MRKLIWVPLLLGLLACSGIVMGAEPPGAAVKAWTAVAPAGPSSSPSSATSIGKRPEGRLGFLERRRLGLTIHELRPLVKTMLDDGRISRDNPSAAAAEVMSELLESNPQWAENPKIDWDAVLEFLEKLIPLIIMLIELFSGI